LSTGAVAAPSANPFGYLSPTRAEHVAALLGEKIEIILDGGATRFGLESTVLDMSEGRPRVLRPGAVTKEAIEELIGVVAVGSAVAHNSPASPGMLKSHYAPRVSLVTHNGALRHIDSAACHNAACHNVAWLFFDGASRDKWLSASQSKPAAVAVLSETGDLNEAAARFFQTLHELDRPGIKRIYAQLAPEKSLGVAINDRLRRAENTHGKE